MRPAIFLDRDDTLLATTEATAGTDHPGDLLDPAAVGLLPGAGEACAALAGLGLPIVLISNQGLVARGRGTLRDVEAVNDRTRALLKAHGVMLSGIYYCPYHPEAVRPEFGGSHSWRKPSPGMFFAAASELELDLANSWAVGDAARDGLAAVTAGLASARVIIVGRGPGLWYPDLGAAAAVMLPQLRQQLGLAGVELSAGAGG